MKNNTAQKNIPSGWQEKKLADVCDIVNGSTPKRSVSEYWDNGDIPWFTVDDIRSNGRIINKTNQSITDKALKETSVKLLPEDSVLLCCTASLGEVALTKIPLTTNQQFNGLVSKDKKNLSPYYLFYSAQKLGEGLKSKSGKTTINFLSVGSLSKEKVLVPPIKEQQKIAEILGTVDDDIAKTQEVIEATEKLKRGLMQQLLSGGDQKKIREIAELNPQQINPLNKPGEEFYYIDIASIKENAVNEAKKFLGKDAPSRARRVLADKDIVISTVRPNLRGYAYISKEYDTYLGSTGFCILRSDVNKIHPKFLYYVISDDKFTDYLVGKTTGSNYPAVNPKDIGDYMCTVPSIDEQKEVAEILSAVDEKISVNKKLKEKLILLKKGLMQDLLSGTVRTNI
jgi:type I restriction enzyme S subunit